MLDIPTLKQDEQQDHIIGMSLGNTLFPLWYMERTWGKEAVDGYLDWMNRMFIDTLITMNHASPMKLVMLNAMTEQNLMGASVRVNGDDDEAILTMVHCSRLAHAIQWAKYGQGPERDLTREGYCDLCLETGLRRIALELGFDFHVEFSPNGCCQTLARRSSETDPPTTHTIPDSEKTPEQDPDLDPE